MSTLTQKLEVPSLRTDVPDGQRRLLLRTTGVMGTVGGVAVAYPFVSSLQPSELARAQGGPVEAEVGDIKPGELRTVAWRGKPIWLMRRTDEMVAGLQKDNPVLADPMSKRSEQPANCQNATRSIKPDLMVAIGVCTHLGCSPTLKLHDEGTLAAVHRDSGFLCPCHGSRFDLAGRVIKNVPAPTNLVIPEYRFIKASTVRIG